MADGISSTVLGASGRRKGFFYARKSSFFLPCHQGIRLTLNFLSIIYPKSWAQVTIYTHDCIGIDHASVM
ncbi:MAG TPA: hypothetical protein VGK10_15595 [Prolixibacteraceae bacterium]